MNDELKRKEKNLEEKSYSVKISLYESQINELDLICENIFTTRKNLINRSIKYALNDYNKNNCIRCRDIIDFIKDEKINKVSTCIKGSYYEKLKSICKSYDIEIKEMIRNIILYYSYKIEEKENDVIG